ncbi:MAG: beta-lactamase family protein [Ruminococcus sp.]|nr:beta-lactamase family protein [Ruminococcus sp.]
MSINGDIVYRYANGTDSENNKLTTDSSIFIASVSKQFCAACIMLLRDKGKLNLNDMLSKYYPEYKIGGKITIKNLLSMRSGIMNMDDNVFPDNISEKNTETENIAAVKRWLFKQPLEFKRDKSYGYSNSNYFLLSDIIEQVSGKKYHDFVREFIFKPLGMKNTGFVSELSDNPEWAKKLVKYDSLPVLKFKGLMNGAVDIISDGEEMIMWLNGLSKGIIVSKKTLGEMTKDYSGDDGPALGYGYGLMEMPNGGYGHNGIISVYSSVDYIHEKAAARFLE